MKKIFCLSCRKRFDTDQGFSDHPCSSIFKMTDGLITIEMSESTGQKLTRWERFIDFILSLDIECGLAFMGGVIINVILLPHFHLSLGETILESASLGFLLMRLLRK